MRDILQILRLSTSRPGLHGATTATQSGDSSAILRRIASMDFPAIYDELTSAADGLDSDDAARRLQQYGPNDVSHIPKASALSEFIADR